MCAGRLEDGLRERLGVAGLDREVQLARLEPARPEHVVDDPREPARLVVDHAEEAVFDRRFEVIAPVPKRHGRAVDGRERRAQLVGDRRDELRLQLPKTMLLGNVSARSSVFAEPPTGTCVRIGAQPGNASRIGLPTISSAGIPMIASAAGFQRRTTPKLSMRKTPSPMWSSTSDARARSWVSARSSAFSIAIDARRASSSVTSEATCAFPERITAPGPRSASDAGG